MPLLNFRFPPARNSVTRLQTVDEREFWERVYHGGRFIEGVSLVCHCDYIIYPVDMFKHPDFFRYNSRNGVVYFANTPGVKLAECIKKLVRRYLKVQGRRIPIS
jgi:hypothetical protein